MDFSWLPLAAFILTAIGWISRELWRLRTAKRQAAYDASETLKDKKTLLEDMVSKIEDASQKEELHLQLDEVNTALLGLHSERLRRTLKAAGLPPEEALIADGLSQLQPQQIDQLKGEISELQKIPLSDSIWDLLALGKAYYYAEQYEDAKAIYDRIINLNPNDPSTLISRGITYGQLGRYHEALADLNRSLELRPDEPTSLTNRGNAYIELGRYEEALADLNRSLELKPDDPATLNNRGITYAKLERYEEALADYNRALELKPDDTDSLFNLACIYSLRGKTNKSLGYLEKAINKDKKYREMAKTDKDFDNIREDPHFKKLIKSD